ncbi:MAG: alanine racemase [Firmicutes bacterium]|nr:alanine racemase [Bacillota bacterium]MBQ6260236.1 alanine racemase [Bacillota bacterium]MBR0114104.1 alanine racemase [Bacillota bacterium]
MRTMAVVHLDRLKRNIERTRAMLPENTRLIAVLKGDAYGHGIAGVLPVFKECGVNDFAVSVWEEGRALREAGAEDAFILLLGDTPDDMKDEVVRYGLTQTLFDVDAARLLNEKAERAKVIQPVHIKIDTGMSRLGFSPEECLEQVRTVASMKNLKITGAFTHFMCADDLSDERTEKQLSLFLKTVEILRDNGIEIPMIHAANSASVLLGLSAIKLDAVRAGDILYGLPPIDRDDWEKTGFEEVMTWETVCAMVKTVSAGRDVGYGATYTTSEETVIATVPVGFADGYSRSLSNKGFVVINGVRCPIIGRVCMDQFMVDATDVPGLKRGDRIELLGEGMTILDMAELLGENVDEIVCRIGKRVPRIYKY